MRKTYSEEDVKQIVENAGYTFLASERDEKYKLRITVKCNNGHEAYSVDFYSFKRGGRCRKCSMKSAKIKSRLKYEDVKKYIESEGYTLVSEEYTNNQSRLEILCPENHLFEMGYSDFKRGRRCRKCSDIRNANHKRKDFDQIRESFEDENYTLISDSSDYKRASTKLQVICPNGHGIDMTWNSFQRGVRCIKCDIENRSAKLRKSFSDVIKCIEASGFEYLEGEYVNNLSKLKLRCSNGHVFYSTYDKIQSTGRGCRQCSIKSAAEKRRLSVEEVHKYINSLQYEWIDGVYKNNESQLTIVCDKGHEFTNRLGNLKSGQRCTKCRISKGESEVKRILEKYDITHIQHYKFDDCMFHKKLTFDFYLSEVNTIIEYDGIFHYQIIKYKGGLDAFVDGKIRDTVKNYYCEKNNITLIRIPYWEFNNIESILIERLNIIN